MDPYICIKNFTFCQSYLYNTMMSKLYPTQEWELYFFDYDFTPYTYQFWGAKIKQLYKLQSISHYFNFFNHLSNHDFKKLWDTYGV